MRKVKGGKKLHFFFNSPAEKAPTGNRRLTLVLSGCYFVLIVIFFSVFLHNNIKRGYEKTDNNYFSKSKNITRLVEEYFSNVDNVATLASKNKQIEQLSKSDAVVFEKMNYFNKQELLQELSVYNSILGIGNHTMLFFKDSGYLVSSYDTGKADKLFGQIIKVEGLTPDELIELFNNKPRYLTEPLIIHTYEGDMTANLYIRCLPLINDRVVLINIIDRNYFGNLFYPHIDSEQENVVFYDSQGIIYYTDIKAEFPSDMLPNESLSANQPFSTNGYYLYPRSTSRLDFIVALAVTDQNRRQALDLNALYGTSLFLLLFVIGTALINICIKLFYKRLGKINRLFESYAGNSTGNSLFTLENNIREIIKKEGELRETIQNESENIRKTYLQLLLEKGLENKEEIIRSLMFLNIDVNSAVWVIVLLESEKGDVAEQVMEYCQDRQMTFESLQEDRYSVILLFDASDVETLRTFVKELLSSGDKVKVACGISRKKQNMFNLADAFNEAKLACKSAYMQSKNIVADYRVIADFQDITFDDTKTQAKISAMLINCELDEITAYLHDFSAQICNGRYDPNKVEAYFIDLWSFMGQFGSRVSLPSLSGEQIPYQADYEDLCMYTLDYARQIISCVQEKKSRKQAVDFNLIQSYINENITSKDLSLKTTAAEFGVSVSYVSRFFSENVGVNFHDYVQTQKIEIAKKLLKETDCSINDICERSGFDNIITFRRIFKSKTGMTPSAYKIIYQGSVS